MTRGDSPQEGEVTEDDGEEISGLAGQPAGRDPAAAGQNSSAALPDHSRFQVHHSGQYW